jgi:hypothetical protein
MTAARWPRTPAPPKVRGTRANLPATRPQVEQLDQRRVQWGERWSETRAAEPWWEPRAARRPDFFEVCSGALHPVRPTSNLFNDVSMSAGMIRSVGSENWVWLCGELFVYRLDHLVEIEGFFKHAAGAE